MKHRRDIIKKNCKRGFIMTENEKRDLAVKIRKDYIVSNNEKDEFDTLLSLNKKVYNPPMIFALITGIIGALVAGFGMSLVMTDLGATLNLSSSMVSGVIIGVLGIFLCIVNFPLYKRFLASRKAKYAGEIIKLTDDFLK